MASYSNTSFSTSAFSINAFDFGTQPDPVVSRDGGSGNGEGDYDEPRRVVIRGKPYTVRSRNEYLGLLARGKRDVARESAEAAIQRSQEAARDALQARSDPVAETGALLHALLERDARKKQLEDEIPIELLMMVAAQL